MLDFEVQKFTRRCAASQRELKPGESFYSILTASGSEVIRQDYAEEAWQGPPDDAIGWWKSEVPDPRAKRLHWAPNDVILHYFQQVHEDPTHADLAYVLALLMIRRRILRIEATESNPQGKEVLQLFCPRNDTEYQITVAPPDPTRATVIQRELAELLFAKADEPTGS